MLQKNMSLQGKSTLSGKNFTLHFLLAAFLALSFFVFAPTSQAGGFLSIDNQEGLTDIAGEFNQSASQPKDPRAIVANVVKTFLSLIGIILVIILIWAGFKYMTAAGNEEKVSLAKKQIIQAIIGLLIILVAYSVTFYVTNKILEASDGRGVNEAYN